MAKQIQLRRGTTAEHNNFTGAVGEVTVDTSIKTLRVHDGVTAGGFRLAKHSEIPSVPSDIGGADYVVDFQMPIPGNNYIWYRKYKSGWLEQGCYIFDLAANGEFTFNFPVPYKSQHEYFINAMGAESGTAWAGAAKRTNTYCIIRNTAAKVNYIDVYTCGRAAN
ncbi:hypothetical protein HDR61_03265 [bacterium]|nr:hypothetical protein [bacterium]